MNEMPFPVASPQQCFPISCLSCRKYHLKCDRILPKCSICEHKKVDCIYLPRKKREKHTKEAVEFVEENGTIVAQIETVE